MSEWLRRVSSMSEVRRTSAGPVEVLVEGAGPAIVLVHGTPGSWRQAQALADDLRDAFTVIRPSRPGYGGTPISSGQGADAQADLYAALLDDLGLDGAAIVGVSGGGPSSLAFAHRHPQRASSLVMACAVAPHLLTVPRALKLARVPVFAEVVSAIVRTLDRQVLRFEATVRRRIDDACTPDERARMADDPRIREDLLALAMSHHLAPSGLAGLRDDVGGFLQHHVGPAEAVTCRTLVLHGTHDPVVPLAHAEHHASVIAGAVLETYDQAGHAFILTRRREVTPRVRAFLSEPATL